MENRIYNITEKTTLGKQDSRDGSCCLRQDKRTVPLSCEMTLGELLALLQPGKRPVVTPTPGELRKTGGEPVASEERCLVYAGGWAVYDNGSGRTVLWLPDCLSFTYRFVEPAPGEEGIVPAEETLPERLLASQPWPVAVTLVGDHRIERNLLNRKGSRKGTRANEDILYGSGLGEDTLDDRILEKIAGADIYRGGNPENAYIRKEAFQEALAAMTAKQRKAFVLYYVYGYNHEEIAAMMNCVVSVVNGHLQAAIKKAKKFF